MGYKNRWWVDLEIKKKEVPKVKLVSGTIGRVLVPPDKQVFRIPSRPVTTYRTPYSTLLDMMMCLATIAFLLLAIVYTILNIMIFRIYGVLVIGFATVVLLYQAMKLVQTVNLLSKVWRKK